jgi:hypothetical protein
MHQGTLRVLVIGETENGSSPLRGQLESRGCLCWFARINPGERRIIWPALLRVDTQHSRDSNCTSLAPARSRMGAGGASLELSQMPKRIRSVGGRHGGKRATSCK